MSMQSHLAELERRHQALEDEISECLTHRMVDDLKIVELKRRKLQVRTRSTAASKRPGQRTDRSISGKF